MGFFEKLFGKNRDEKKGLNKNDFVHRAIALHDRSESRKMFDASRSLNKLVDLFNDDTIKLSVEKEMQIEKLFSEMENMMSKEYSSIIKSKCERITKIVCCKVESKETERYEKVKDNNNENKSNVKQERNRILKELSKQQELLDSGLLDEYEEEDVKDKIEELKFKLDIVQDAYRTTRDANDQISFKETTAFASKQTEEAVSNMEQVDTESAMVDIDVLTENQTNVEKQKKSVRDYYNSKKNKSNENKSKEAELSKILEEHKKNGGKESGKEGF